MPFFRWLFELSSSFCSDDPSPASSRAADHAFVETGPFDLTGPKPLMGCLFGAAGNDGNSDGEALIGAGAGRKVDGPAAR